METRREKFETLNSYIKITKNVGLAVGIIACIPLVIGGASAGIGFLIWIFDDIEEALPVLIPSFTGLGISFSLFYAAGLLLIISELIQCFLAIEENTYQSAQNTSYLHQEVTDET